MLREYPELVALADLHDAQASQLTSAVDAVGLLGEQPPPAQLLPLLRNVTRLLDAHVVEEERDIFPHAQQVIGDERAKELDAKFIATSKQIKREQLEATKH